MITIYSEAHASHCDTYEVMNGELTPCFETPQRAFSIVKELKFCGLSDIRLPDSHGISSYASVHDEAYVRFLSDAWKQWSDAGRRGSALPLVWPVRGNVTAPPDSIDGRLGYYSMDTCAPITAGTWEAVCASADTALTGAGYLERGHRAAFALCRPPGHHASRDCMGGYCYLNNAALAAQKLIDGGAHRIAILDVDYHHGNGTQHIFYDRADVLFVSLHADTRVSYPYFSGRKEEVGNGIGYGFNKNYPLPHGVSWGVYGDVLANACSEIERYAPDALVVSLGVDTHEDDPIGRFRLQEGNYLRMGEIIGRLDIPTLLVMEGGYLIEKMASNVVSVVASFDGVKA
ncbi:histone deacetylase family protein [Paraburkholderia flava]|uniref:histone deacetylase family protein n=1 Tax=Paraburkholderia flava TaxID=2547393 RepID=UPI0010608AB7|nr:histone deacetylase family protein [Paraburkholderia flava]